MILGMVSILSAQSSVTVKNSVIGYAEVGDTVSFSKPILFSYVKSDDSKWFATFFWGPTWNDEKIYIEELFYKPYSVANGGKFNIGFGQQLIPYGSNLPYLDLTRRDMFTYQTSWDVGTLVLGRGVSVYGGLRSIYVETYFGDNLEYDWKNYQSTRVSYEVKGQTVALSADNHDRQAIDVSGYNKHIEYIGEYSLSHDYHFARAVVKPGMYGLNLLAGYESFDGESKPLYGVMWTFDGDYPGSFLSVEFGNEGDLLFKINADLGILKLGDSKNE
jgi:hypothetical protein